MEDLIKEITDDLTIELGLSDADKDVMEIKVKNAVKAVRKRRSYPKNMQEKDIESDLVEHYSNIRDIALYDYNQRGAEGHTMYTENNISRMWKNREECFKGVTAYVELF